jgi:hypothetical protein
MPATTLGSVNTSDAVVHGKPQAHLYACTQDHWSPVLWSVVCRPPLVEQSNGAIHFLNRHHPRPLHRQNFIGPLSEDLKFCLRHCLDALSSVQPSGISVPTFLQHAPDTPACLRGKVPRDDVIKLGSFAASSPRHCTRRYEAALFIAHEVGEELIYSLQVLGVGRCVPDTCAVGICIGDTPIYFSSVPAM